MLCMADSLKPSEVFSGMLAKKDEGELAGLLACFAQLCVCIVKTDANEQWRLICAAPRLQFFLWFQNQLLLVFLIESFRFSTFLLHGLFIFFSFLLILFIVLPFSYLLFGSAVFYNDSGSLTASVI